MFEAASPLRTGWPCWLCQEPLQGHMAPTLTTDGTMRLAAWCARCGASYETIATPIAVGDGTQVAWSDDGWAHPGFRA